MSEHAKQKMPSKKVKTVSGDEEYIRLDIYEGRIPLGEAGDRLLELQLKHHERFQEETLHLWKVSIQQGAAIDAIYHRFADIATPWPVRWYRYFKAMILKRRTI